VSGHEGVVWAVSDCAAVPDGNGGVHPPTAQHAMREAIVAAKNIEAVVTGAAQKPFRFSVRRCARCAAPRSRLAALPRSELSG
jgi:NADH dehydrogenase FAD-containing subunit